MNLKESFRYQSFLESLMYSAITSIEKKEHCLKTTKEHMKKKANPDAEDLTEEIEVEEFYPNDDVIRFMEFLVEERYKLTSAIGKAKASTDFDIDAAIETNKFRQNFRASIKRMLLTRPSTKTEVGKDYNFNVDGNQVPYFYDITVTTEEAFDRIFAKKTMKNMIIEADKTSNEIESTMINTPVDYLPIFDVNDSFEDVMEQFLSEEK